MPYDNGGRYGAPAPPLRDPWRAQSPFYAQPVQPRRDVYGQPQPPPQRGNGFFWDWH